MRRMTTIAAIAILITVTKAQAGWLSNIGQRIVNGAINTVQTNISGKVNKTIDNVMDGKLATQQKNNSQSHVDEYSGHPGLPNTGASAGGPAPIINNQVDSSSPVLNKGTIKSTGKYEDLDWGNLKFRGERVYGTRIVIGERVKKIDVQLEEGTYLFILEPISYDASVSVVGKYENEGLQWGRGIQIKKTIINGSLLDLDARKGGTVQMVQVGSNGGHLEAAMANEASLKGAMEFLIYKIPGPTLK